MKTGRAVHVLFGLSLAALCALGVWWFVFFERSVSLEREARLRELRAAVVVRALSLGHARHPPGPGPLAGPEPLEVVPWTGGATEDAFARRTLPRHPGLGVRVLPAALSSLEAHARRRRVMVAGEGGLLVVLILVCTSMLYRLVRLERQHAARMDRFLGAVTHEMKTPLAGMKSLLQTLAEGRVPAGQEGRLLAMGLKEAERLEHMVENVLLSGRLRADVEQVRLEPVALRRLLEEFVEHRRRYLVDRPDAVRLAWELDEDDVPASVDASAVRVVLDNLVDNALKYGGAEPLVTLRARREGGRLAVAVEDAGRGFPPEKAADLFVPFHRATAPDAAVQHGTGLGLSISRSLARRMGGDLTAHSDGPSRGARFTLVLGDAT